MKFKNTVYDYLGNNQGCDYIQLYNFLKKHFTNESNLDNMLSELINDENIYFNLDTKNFFYANNKKWFIGKVYKSKNVFWVSEWFHRTDVSYAINISFMNTAINKDLVLFTIDNNQAIIHNVVKRVEPLLVGLCLNTRGSYIFLADNAKFSKKIYIVGLTKNLNNYKVIIKNLKEYESYYEAEIDKVLGYKYDPGIDVKLAVARFNLFREFDKDTLREAENSDFEKDADYNLRKDLTNLFFITIDGKTAKDLDDAIYVEKTCSGYNLKVAIADVANYVDWNSNMDNEAKARGNSIYLLNTVIPMLPRKLSNDLCSLNPNTKKKVLVCDMNFDNLGKMTDYSVYNATIISKERHNYGNVNDYFNKRKHTEINNVDILNSCFELYKKINKRFIDKGYLEFNIPEVQIILNKNNFPIDIKTVKSGDAEKLIEFFMLSANKAIANFMTKNSISGIYRVHGKPVSDKFFEALDIIKLFKNNVKILKKDENITGKYIQYLLNLFNPNNSKTDIEHEQNYIASTLILRSMDRAKYSFNNKGHFAIGINDYCHFTSPIRRYADLVCHRNIKNFLAKKNQKIEDINIVCSNLNLSEFLTQKCEWYLQKLKKAQYLQNSSETEFVGIISDIRSVGFLVSLPNTIEGFVSMKNMGKDFFEFDKNKKVFTGKRTRKIYSFGNKVKVKVKYINVFNGNIDFSIINENNSKK